MHHWCAKENLLSRCDFQRRGFETIEKVFCIFFCRALLVSINRPMLITEIPIARPIKKVSGSRTPRSSWRQPWQDFSSRPPCSSCLVLRASKCAAKYARAVQIWVAVGCAASSAGVEVAKYFPRLQDTQLVHSPPAPAKVYGQLQKGRSSLKKGAMGEILSHSLAAGAAFPFPLIFIASTSAGDLVIYGLDQRQRFQGYRGWFEYQLGVSYHHFQTK